MTSLIAFHWVWLFGALIIGVIVGAMTWQKIRLSWLDRWVHIVLAVVAIAIVVALLKLVHGRPGYWLDLALWTLLPYVVGCFVGWGLRELAEHPGTADVMRALAAARPPEGKSYDSYTGPLETTYVNKPGETPLYRPGSGIVDPRAAIAQSPEWDAATAAKGGAAPTGMATTAADGTPLETPYVSKPGQTPLFRPGSGIVDYRTALAATVAKAGDVAGAIVAPAVGAVSAVAAKAKGLTGSAGTAPDGTSLSAAREATPPGAGATRTERLGDAPAAALAGKPTSQQSSGGTGAITGGASTSAAAPSAGSSPTASPVTAAGSSDSSSRQLAGSTGASKAAQDVAGGSASTSSSGAGATLPDPPPAAAVPNEDQHAGERPQGFADARGGKADDLKRIKGIGPQNEGRLHGLGIWHFDQIAAWTPDNVKWVGSYLAFHGRIDREKWIEQAKALAAGQDTEFSRRVAAGKVATSRDDGSLGQHNVASTLPHTKN